MIEVSYFAAGVLLGALVGAVLAMMRHRATADQSRAMLDDWKQQRAEELDRVVGQLRDAFGNLSREALAGNSEEFLKLAKARLSEQTSAGSATLEEKKKLIDAGLETLNKRVGELHVALHASEKTRGEAFARLTKEVEGTSRVTEKLNQTTAQLTNALASSQHRGQWGERMAEDVLRLAGLLEGVNYRKQDPTPGGTKPDFVFLLPSGPRLNMDVKFPLDNYLRYLDAEGDEAIRFRKAFVGDVRSRIREVTTREYIDTADGTIDFVLVFIPNEQIYGFVHETDPDLLEFAISRKVVLCSPLTLFAILAVVRQAADNFRLQQASNEILKLLGEFQKQWEKYGEVVERLGRALESTMKAYSELTSTRSRQLERQLDKVDELRRSGDELAHAPATGD